MTSMKKLASRRGFLVGCFLIGIVLLTAIASTDNSDEFPPYDPESAQRDGTKALKLLMEHYGSEVTIGGTVTGGFSTTAMLFNDDLSRDEASEVLEWVESGGKLVVLDPQSGLVDILQGDNDVLRQPLNLKPDCLSSNVNGVAQIEPTHWRDYAIFESSESMRCFPVSDGAFMVEIDRGSGTIVLLGGGDIFTNEQIAKADNSVLAVNLFDPQQGSKITFLATEAEESAGRAGLLALVPDNVYTGLLQLCIAAAALVIWRSRRVGFPVAEPLPVEVPSSQLTVAIGSMLQKSGQSSAAAEVMRDDFRNRLAKLMAMDSGASPESIAEVVSRRTGIDKERLLSLLLDAQVNSDTGLVEYAKKIEDTYREVSSVR